MSAELVFHCLGFFQSNFKKKKELHIPEAATAALLKKRLWHRFVPVIFVKYLRTCFL